MLTNLTTIGAYAFNNCNNLGPSLDFSKTKLSNIGSYAFCNNTSIKNINFYSKSSGLTIGQNSFQKTGITSLDTGNITAAGRNTFSDSASLISVIVRESLSVLPISFTYNCTNLVSVTLPENLKSIDSFAFANCISLREITLPNSITSIGADAFCEGGNYGNAPLKNLAIFVNSNSVETLLRNVFTGVVVNLSIS